jgi:LysR family transcriptional regulator, glycine cleavage system transcriptional activator
MMHNELRIPALPPLVALPAVAIAARSGSFSAAAIELGLTHSAISRRVKSVETWLGTDLFERQGRGVALTPAGHRFTQAIDQAFGLIAQFGEQYRPGRHGGIVRISAVPSFARLWLVGRVNQLQGTPPDVRIEIMAQHRVAQLESGEADIAIRYGLGPWPGLAGWSFPAETLLPAVSREFAEANALVAGIEAPPEKIASMPLLHDSDVRLWRAWFEGTGVTVRPRPADRRFEDYDMVLASIKAGLGVGLLRLPIAKHLLKAPGIVLLSKRGVLNPLRHHILVSKTETRQHVLELVGRMKAVVLSDYQGNVLPW